MSLYCNISFRYILVFCIHEHTYNIKCVLCLLVSDSDVVKALPLLMTVDDAPAPTKCPTITEQRDASAKQPVPVTEPKQPVQERLLALASTLTPGGDKDVFDLPATTTPEPASVSRTSAPDVTTVPVTMDLDGWDRSGHETSAGGKGDGGETSEDVTVVHRSGGLPPSGGLLVTSLPHVYAVLIGDD